MSILVFISILGIMVYAASYNNPSEFGNETNTTCLIGGSQGIVNCTGQGILSSLNVSGTIEAVTFTGNSTIWSRTGTDVILTNINDRVGIGTSTPTQKLTIIGNVNITGNLSIGNGTFFYNQLTDRVGIGTTLPTETLTIIGNLSVEGNDTRLQNVSAINYRNASGALNWIRPENIYDVDYENICLPGESCPFAFNISGTNVFPQMADWNVGLGLQTLVIF